MNLKDRGRRKDVDNECGKKDGRKHYRRMIGRKKKNEKENKRIEETMKLKDA